MMFIYHNKSKECKKAYLYLINHSIEFIERELDVNKITYNELVYWMNKYNINIEKLINKKSKIVKRMSKITINDLVNDYRLINKPLLIGESFFLIGFTSDYENLTKLQ